MFLLSKVPAGHTAGNDEVLAGDTELGDPEPPEDVVPPHPGHEGVRLVLDVGRDGVRLGVAGREDPEGAVEPEDGGDAEGGSRNS